MSSPRAVPAFVLGDGVNALGVIRSLGRRGVPVHLYNDVEHDLAALSRYVRSVHTVDADDAAGTVRLILADARRLGPDVRPALIYASDRNLRLVSGAREALAGRFRMQVPSAEAVEIVTDKAAFARFTEENGFPAPRTFTPATLAQAEEVAAKVRYPALLKPALSFHWAGRRYKVRKARQAASLVAAWKHLHSAGSAVVVQEYIEAPDDQHYAYYSYRAPGRGERAHVLVRKLRVFPIHDGVGSFLEITRDAEMEELGAAVLERLDYAGVASVCFKKERASGAPFIYEVNGRFPQCHAAFTLCGYDVPYLMYRDLVGDPLPDQAYRESTKRWVGLSLDISAFRQYRERGELGVLDWLSSYARVGTCAEFAWDDARPLLALLGRIGRHLVVGARPRDGARNRAQPGAKRRPAQGTTAA